MSFSKKLVTCLLFNCALTAVVLHAQVPAPIRSWADAEKIEAKLVDHPDDIDTRVQLLQYYSQQGQQSVERAKPLRLRHILWLIEHHPENTVLSQWPGAMDKSGTPLSDAEGFEACSAAWQTALSASKPLFDTYANAVWFYRTSDPARARSIAESGLKVYPGNARISERKGMLLAYRIAGVKTDQSGTGLSFDEELATSAQAEEDRRTLEASDDVNLLGGAAQALGQQAYALQRKSLNERVKEIEDLAPRLYRRAIAIDPNGRWKSDLIRAYQNFAGTSGAPPDKVAFLEKALAVAGNSYQRTGVLSDLAQQYLAAGNIPKASETAREIVHWDESLTGTHTSYWIFAANQVLGQVALRQGDLKEAGRLLVASAGPNVQPLTSTPYDWALVEGLLGAGDADSVLLYLERLRTLWKNDNGKLNEWASIIRGGGIPEFRANNQFPTLRYIGRPAPDFRLKDLKGNEVTLAEFKGKVVLVDFWATWCGPCRQEMPDFEKIHRQLAAQDVVVLALDANEPVETVAGYIEKEKYTFPVLLANGTNVMSRYSVNAYPTTFAIDKNGVVADINVGSGAENSSRLHAMIEKARAGAPPASPVASPTVARVLPPPTTSTTAEDLFRDSVRQHGLKDYAGAIGSLDRALQLRPAWIPALVEKADCHMHAKEYTEALAEYDHIIDLAPARAASYNGRGLCNSNAGKHDRAVPDYTRAIELNPEFQVAYNNRGWAYLELGRYDEALADLNKALELNPAYSTALFNRAHVYEKRGDYQRAIADFDSVLHLEPLNTSATNQKNADQRKLAPGEGAGSAQAGAPRLISPPDGAVFDHYPRETTVVWSPVPGAKAYMVEWDFKSGDVWHSDTGQTHATQRTTDPVATFQFVGAQPGRWRVWTLDANEAAGPKSEWREFRYTR